MSCSVSGHSKTIYLQRGRVGDPYNLLSIDEKVGGFCMNIPRPRRWLGEGIHWLAYFKQNKTFWIIHYTQQLSSSGKQNLMICSTIILNHCKAHDSTL